MDLEDIKSFSINYNKDKRNKEIEKEITSKGINLVCLSDKIKEELPFTFNIELSETKRYNQTGNGRCWIYAGINMIKRNIADNMSICDENLELSINYLAFFDKLEKSNNIYNFIIKQPNIEISDLLKEKILPSALVFEGGHFEFFRFLVKKYGIVPNDIMGESIDSQNSKKFNILYTQKVKKDIKELIDLNKRGIDREELYKRKKVFLQENYNILSKILGEPKFKFDYKYKDKNNNIVELKDITPLEFRDRVLTINLDDFVSVGNFPMYNKQYGKKYKVKYFGYDGDIRNKILNLPIEEVKDLTVKQLKNNIPVWFGCDPRKEANKKLGILSESLYNYEQLGIKDLTKEENLNFYDTRFKHCMNFVGVNIEDGQPNRWKVEDSYGLENSINGYYIMSDNFFEKYVYQVIIHKQYLSDRQLKMWNEKELTFETYDPF